MSDPIQIFKPWFEAAEHEALRAPLETGWVGYGEKARTFEKRFAHYIGVKHAIALHSCTAALHLAMVASGVEGRHRVLVRARVRRVLGQRAAELRLVALQPCAESPAAVCELMWLWGESCDYGRQQIANRSRRRA